MGGVVAMEAKPTRDVNTAVKIQCVMTRMGISQTQLARNIGATLPMVNQVIWGTKQSRRVQSDIARSLGFKSWNELKKHKEVV